MDGWRIDPHRLRSLRSEAELDQLSMARELGCHRRHYYRFETEASYRGEPSRELADAICAVLSRKLGRQITLADVAHPAPSRFKVAG